MFEWKPFSDKQIRVLSWWLPRSPHHKLDGIICDGSIRSGKTVCMGFSYVLWAMHSFDGCNFAIAGKTVGSVRRNVTADLTAMLTGAGFKVRELVSRGCIDVTRGAVSNRFYLFGGKDEGSAALIQGVTLAGCLFDEAALMPRSFVEQAAARCSVKGAKLWFNCNPEGPAHWFKREWIDRAADKRMLRLHFTMEDNLSLPPSTRERYERMYTGVFYDRFILGRWSAAEGVIYDMFDRSRHVLNVLPDIDSKAPVYISCDYGTLNPCVFLMWKRAVSGRWICVKEYYYSGREKGIQKTDEEYAGDLGQFIGGEAVRSVIVDPSAASFIECLRRHGLPVMTAKNDVMSGIGLVSSLLKQERIGFMDCCVRTVGEFGMYIWDKKAADRGADAPLKQNDHAMDAVRYFANTVLAPGRRVGTSIIGRVI